MKCGWKHCKHGGEVDKADAIKEGTRYYHPDCLREKKAMMEIVEIYHERIDEHPIETLLHRVVNDLVFKDGYGAEFLLFALKYCLDHGWTLRSPNGLRYVARDSSAKQEWEKRQMQKNNTVTQVEISGETDYATTPIVNTNKQRGFASILGR